jgi:hypothetical protein
MDDSLVLFEVDRVVLCGLGHAIVACFATGYVSSFLVRAYECTRGGFIKRAVVQSAEVEAVD